MTNFQIKYTSCLSKIARETDLEIKIAENTQTSLRKVTSVKLELCNSSLVLFYNVDIDTTEFEHIL